MSRSLVLALLVMMLVAATSAAVPMQVAGAPGSEGTVPLEAGSPAIFEENGVSYHLMTEQEMLSMRERIGVRQPGVDYNVLVDGHGTGLAPPTEEEWEKMVGTIRMVDSYSPDGLSLPSSYDISSQSVFPMVGNQRSQGSCAAWAATYYAYGYLEAKDNGWTDAKAGTNKSHLMSPAWTYNKVNGGSDHGSWMGENFQIAIEWGVASQATHPYNDNDDVGWGGPEAFREAPLHRAASYQVHSLTGDQAVNQVKEMISQDRPITFAMNAGYYTFDNGKYIVTAEEYEAGASLNHAQTVVGYDDSVTEDGEVGAFRIVNSWGSGWGNGGYYWITYQAFKEICGSYWQSLTEVIDRADYVPSLVAVWHHNDPPVRAGFIMAEGSYPSYSKAIWPFFQSDSGNDLPAFMCLDVSDFRGDFDAGASNFWIELSNGGSGSLSSFKMESYDGAYVPGVPTQVSSQSSEIPKSLPGHASLSFAKYVSVGAEAALDHPGTSFTSSGQARWTGVAHTSYSGGSAMQSGDVADGYHSLLQTTVSGASGVSFYWKVSSESSKDKLRFFVDGTLMNDTSGNVDWTKKTFTLTSSTHILKWNYTRDSANCGNKDTAWVDKVAIIPQDDSYEENDIPSQAPTLVSTGTYAGLVGLDDDWYRVRVETDDMLTVDLDLNSSEGDLDLFLYGTDGTTLIDSSQTAGDAEEVLLLATASGYYYLNVRPDSGQFARYSMTFLYESGALDYGKNSSLTIISGTGAFSSIMPGKVVTVVTGSVITGTIGLRSTVTWSDVEQVPLVGTSDWGSPSSSYFEAASDLSQGTTEHMASVSSLMPTEPGIYYLIFAFRNESSSAHVASATSHFAGSPVWDDGNDVASLTSVQINESRVNGRTLGDWLRADGLHSLRIPSDAVMLNVIPPDTTPPVTSSSLSGLAGAGGWYRSSVTATLEADDAGGSGVDHTWCRIDQGAWFEYLSPIQVSGSGTHTIEYYSVDLLNNSETAKSTNAKIDLSAPTTSASVSGTIGGDGWYVSAAQLSLTAYDALSGVQVSYFRVDGGSWTQYSPGASIASDGQHNVEYYSVDLAGNSESWKQRRVPIDCSAPISSVTLSGEEGTDDWFLGQVRVSIMATDLLSGVSGLSYRLDDGGWQPYASPFNVTSEGPHQVLFNATDAAGNPEVAQSIAFQIDFTPPSSGIEVNGTAGQEGWYLSAVEVQISADDALSGLKGVQYSLDGGPWLDYSTTLTISSSGEHVLLRRASDMAGNLEEVVESRLKVDNSPPQSDLGQNGTSGSAGWFLSEVELTPEGSDMGSGVSAYLYRLDGGGWSTMDGAMVLSEEGDHTFEMYAVDLAGNIGPAITRQIRIDMSAPITALTASGSQGEEGWFVSLVDMELQASDAMSGTSAIYCSIQGAAWRQYAATLTLDAEGVYEVRYYAVDAAGNVEPLRSAEVKLELSLPSSSLDLSGEPGRAGWFVSEVTASIAASDTMSGVSCTYYRLDGAHWQDCNGSVIVPEGRHVLDYYSVDHAGNQEPFLSREVWVDTEAPVTLGVTHGDRGSGPWFLSEVMVSLLPSDEGSGLNQTRYRVDSGSWTNYSEPFGLTEEGAHRLCFYSTDLAGNEAPICNLTVMMDLVAPVSWVTLEGRPGSLDWFVSQVNFTLSVDEAVSGLSSTEWRLDGGDWQDYEGEVNVSTPGSHMLEYRSSDRAGNRESVRLEFFKMDLDTPVLRSSNTGKPFTTKEVTLDFDPEDAGSSVSKIEVSIDGGPAFLVNNGPWTVDVGGLSDGWHLLDVVVTDSAGNALHESINFKVDTNPFSPEGPFGPWLLIGLAALAIAALLLVVPLRGRKK